MTIGKTSETEWDVKDDRLGYGYSKDDRSVYFHGKIVKTNGIFADPKTFRKIKTFSEHYKDKNFVYYNGERVPDSDVKTFVVLDEWPYCKDKRHLYYQNHVINFIDIKSFEIIEGRWAKDKNHVYSLYCDINVRFGSLRDIIDERFDAKSFEILDDMGHYVKDKNGVYYADKLMHDADPATFRIGADGIAKDKYHTYKYGKIIS
jgi:hypothetical protein